MNVDIATGELIENAGIVEFVPLNLSTIDEARALLPTPQQCAIALMQTRAINDQAPAILAQRSAALKEAQKVLTIALDYAARRVVGRDAYSRKLAIAADPDVLDAQTNVDIAAVALEFARNRSHALDNDIDILRSLNANFRGEHS